MSEILEFTIQKTSKTEREREGERERERTIRKLLINTIIEKSSVVNRRP